MTSLLCVETYLEYHRYRKNPNFIEGIISILYELLKLEKLIIR